mmetsp:Transcript_31086/g.93181  ORF Transcript_31086/g.93181 Transcript_31086/m.93181 type:complete len:234 (+) Transcript_31086:611-1312(+)
MRASERAVRFFRSSAAGAAAAAAPAASSRGRFFDAFALSFGSMSPGATPRTLQSRRARALTSPPHFNPSATSARFNRSSPNARSSSSAPNFDRSNAFPAGAADCSAAHLASNAFDASSSNGSSGTSGCVRFQKSDKYASTAAAWRAYAPDSFSGKICANGFAPSMRKYATYSRSAPPGADGRLQNSRWSAPRSKYLPHISSPLKTVSTRRARSTAACAVACAAPLAAVAPWRA